MQGFYQITDNIINLGLRKEHKLMHISDTHICCIDELSTEEEAAKAQAQEKIWEPVRRDFAHHFNEPWNPEHEIPTSEAFDKIIDYAAKMSPECLLMSGDILDYVHPAGIRHAVKKLSQYGGNYLFANGNHEGPSASNPDLMQLNGGNDDIGVYRGEDFIITSIDNSTKKVPQKQLEQLKALMQEGKPIVLMMHIPLSLDYNKESMQKFGNYFLIFEDDCDDSAKELISLIKPDDSPIRSIICGHVHGYHKCEFAKGREQICSSSSMAGFIDMITLR